MVLKLDVYTTSFIDNVKSFAFTDDCQFVIPWYHKINNNEPHERNAETLVFPNSELSLKTKISKESESESESQREIPMYISPSRKPSRYRYLYPSGEQCYKDDVVFLKESDEQAEYIVDRGNGEDVDDPGVLIHRSNERSFRVKISWLAFVRRGGVVNRALQSMSQIEYPMPSIIPVDSLEYESYVVERHGGPLAPSFLDRVSDSIAFTRIKHILEEEEPRVQEQDQQDTWLTRSIGVFGDPFVLEETFIKRSDPTFKNICNHVFRSSGSSRPQITVVYGEAGIGKTMLAKFLCNEVTSHDRGFDHVGYFNGRCTSTEHIYLSFHLHFSPLPEEFDQGHLLSLSIPDTALDGRILLVIDDCDDLSTLEPFLCLGPKSHIVLTTRRVESFSDGCGIVYLPLGPMKQRDVLNALTFRYPQKQILRFLQQHPLAIALLEGLVHESGPVSIDKLFSHIITTDDTPFHLLIDYTVQQIGPGIEIELFRILSRFRNWTPLPYPFILECWSWIAQKAGIPWDDDRSQRLLHTLEKRGLITVTEWRFAEMYCSVPVCELVYPYPLKTVSVHNTISEYYQAGSASPSSLVSHCISGVIQSGKYNYLLMFADPQSSDPVFKFLLEIHRFYLDTDINNRIKTYLSNHPKDLPAIGTWVCECLRAHFLRKSPCVECPCVEWAQAGMEYLLMKKKRPFFVKMQSFVNDLLACPEFYSSPAAVTILKSLSTLSPKLATDILHHIQADPIALDELCQSPRVLVHVMSCGSPLPPFFDSIVELLVTKVFEDDHLYGWYHSSMDLLRLVIAAQQGGQLSKPEIILGKLRAYVDSDPIFWLPKIRTQVELLKLPETHWIYPLLTDHSSLKIIRPGLKIGLLHYLFEWL